MSDVAFPNSTFPLIRIGHLAELQLGKMLQPLPHSNTDIEVAYLRAGHLPSPPDELPLMWTTQKERRQYEVREGDLLVAEGGDVGRAEFAPPFLGNAVIQNSLHRVRAERGNDLRFLRYGIQALYSINWFDVYCNKSTFGHLTSEKLAALKIPAPPEEQQGSIADFLDAETARIDALITKKRRLLLELDERLISSARSVLMGKKEHGARRKTGLPWLPDVPVAWEIAPIYSRYDVLLGRMVNEARSANGDMRPYLRNANIRWDRIDISDIAFMDFPLAERNKYQLKSGDLLICEGGAGVGRAAVWNGELDECYYQKSLHRVRSRGRWPVEWLIEWLRVCKHMGVFAGEGNLATIPHLTAEQLRSHRIPFPAPERSHELLGILTAERRETATLQSLVSEQIALLKERRQALITAAVTGQVEIPGAAA